MNTMFARKNINAGDYVHITAAGPAGLPGATGTTWTSAGNLTITTTNNTNSINPNSLSGYNSGLTIKYSRLTLRWSFGTTWTYVYFKSKPEAQGYIKCLVEMFVLTTNRQLNVEYIYETPSNETHSYNALFETDEPVNKYQFNTNNWSDELELI